MLPDPGEDFNLGSWVVGHDLAEEYLRVVDDGSSVYRDLGVVPPLALAARALGALLKELGLPPGAIHASQELDCRRTVSLGEEVSCIARLSRPIRRGDWQFISADFNMYAADGEGLISGKSTVLVPLAEVEGE